MPIDVPPEFALVARDMVSVPEQCVRSVHGELLPLGEGKEPRLTMKAMKAVKTLTAI